MSVGTSGLTVRTESLAAIVEGGIAFDTPVTASAGEPSKEGATFGLYPAFESIKEAQFTIRVPFLVYFQGRAGGRAPGAPGTCRGFGIGEVKDVHLQSDVNMTTTRIPVMIDIELQRIQVVGPMQAARHQEHMARSVSLALRAQLRSGSLLPA